MLYNIGFVGAGNLTESVVRGLSAGQEKPNIIATDLSQERLNVLRELYGIKTGELEQVVKESNVIILAIKPKDVAAVLSSLASYSLSDKLIISVAAGIPLAILEKGLPGVPFVRIMPNTSCAVLLSMTGMVQGSLATNQHKETAEAIFSQVGQVLWITEDKMNAITAISGSGPAYYYLFTEYLVAAGVELGLTPEQAEILARETLTGASQMLARSGKTPARLRQDVTSPNGTTYAALQLFEKADLKAIVLNAAKAAADRAAEMEKEYNNAW